MSEKLPYMPLFVNDYLSDTTFLTCEEHGAYLLILMSMWKSGGSLPCDDVALSRIARLPASRWKKMRTNVLSFFRVEGAALTHKRITAQIKKVEEIKSSRSSAGKRGAEAKRLKSLGPPQANADELLEQTLSKNQPSQISNTQNINNLPASQPGSPAPARAEPGGAACVEIGKKITDYMGVTNDPRWLGNWSSVSVWMAKGYDPNLDIIPTVFAMVDRLKLRKKSMPVSLNYFERAIAENHKRRVETGETPSLSSAEIVTVRKGTPEFAAWIAHFRRLGRKTAFRESQSHMSVPSQFPPQVSTAIQSEA